MGSGRGGLHHDASMLLGAFAVGKPSKPGQVKSTPCQLSLGLGYLSAMAGTGRTRRLRQQATARSVASLLYESQEELLSVSLGVA